MVDADGEKDLEFNTSWSVVDIDMWFWRLLPKAFKWLDARHGPLDIHWVLLNSDRLNLFIVTQPTITGKELDEVKGSASRSIMSRSIAIGMCSSSMPTMTVSNITGPAAPRIPISFTVYSNWDSAIHRSSHPSMLAHRMQDILTISDSKSDDLDDCHAGGTADEISDYSSDIVAPTRARKNKGKGKAVAVPINTLIKLTESDCEFQIVAGSAGPLTIKPTCYRGLLLPQMHPDSESMETSLHGAAQSNGTPHIFNGLESPNGSTFKFTSGGSGVSPQTAARVHAGSLITLHIHMP